MVQPPSSLQGMLSSLEDVQEVYHWFHQMQTTQPAWLDESSGCWQVFRYDDVYRVITDYRFFPSQQKQRPMPSLSGSALSPAPNLFAMDPPLHHQYRELVSPAFARVPCPSFQPHHHDCAGAA